MSVAIPTIDQMSVPERDEMLGRLVLDAFSRRGFGAIPVRYTGASVAMVVPRIEPAAITTIPDLPAEFVEEIRRRAATPEEAL